MMRSPLGREHILFRHYQPLHLEPGKKYPLFFWLHGWYGRGSDNRHQILGGGNHHGPGFLIGPKIQDWRPSFVLAPQCPRMTAWVNFASHQIMPPLEMAHDLLLEYIAENPIDPERVYIMGQSMGGFATWATLLEMPDLFAAALPVSGGGKINRADEIAHIPMWVFHGENDKLVRPWRSRRMVSALREAGGYPRFTTYPGMPHNIWKQVFSEPGLPDWLISHRRILE